MSFVVGDAGATVTEPASVVLLIDALHYFPEAEQVQMLLECRRRLVGGGVLVLRDAVRIPGPRFWWNWLHERAMLGLSLTKARRAELHFRSESDILSALDAAGFDVLRVIPGAGWRPYTSSSDGRGRSWAADVQAAATARSAMCCPMASDAVAAGLGALNT